MENQFINVPARTLPNGVAVPAFQAGKYLCSRTESGLAAITAGGKPWVRINYANARKACEAAGFRLITETQWLSLSLDIASLDVNWTGGKVGEGSLRQGLCQWSVREAQPGSFAPADESEQRMFTLSNGEQICDAAGNAFSWVFDDVQGDDDGLIAKPFTEDSISLSAAPHPSREKGMGWRPSPGSNWSGSALIRGGFWLSEDDAGVFDLNNGWPDSDYLSVGFRCTK